MKPQWNLGEAPCETTEKRRRSAHAESSMFCTSRRVCRDVYKLPLPTRSKKTGQLLCLENLSEEISSISLLMGSTNEED